MALMTERVPILTDGSQFRIIANIMEKDHRFGYLRVFNKDGSMVLDNIKCRAKGLSGLYCNETNGNTPYGQWLGQIYSASPNYDVGSRCPEDTGAYGPSLRIRLESAYNGYAKVALDNGRSGFYIHGGRWCENNTPSHLLTVGEYNGEDFKMWNTSGCIRLSNPDQELLINTLANIGYGLGVKCLVDVNWIFDTSDLPTSW